MELEEYNKKSQEIKSHPNYKEPVGFAMGIRSRKDTVSMDVFYPKINIHENKIFGDVVLYFAKEQKFKNGFIILTEENLKEIFNTFKVFHSQISDHPNLKILEKLLSFYKKENSNNLFYGQKDIIVYFCYDDQSPINSVEEAYFKLTAISQRKKFPHEQNLQGLFGILKNIAWTNKGAILVEDIEAKKLDAMVNGEDLFVTHVDKFPYMVNYVVPSGVRIADGCRARLGAYLGEGTTIMPAGYVNFNAGTKGQAMVEGRISAGVVVNEKSDVGGGGSIMGTLSGGNQEVLSVGSQCLIGANAGIGISLGNGCTVAAGIYLTASSKVYLYNKEKQPIDLQEKVVEEGKNIFRAKQLSGKDYLLFYLDTSNGKLICRPNSKVIELNKELHCN